jgi:hypothetical protein
LTHLKVLRISKFLEVTESNLTLIINIINIKEIQMRKILFAVLAAVASAASHKGRFVSVSEEIPILFDAEPAQAF